MPWYVARTRSQHEIKTSEYLSKLGVEVFCPTIVEVRQWSDRKKKVTVPLFRSYIFVNIAESERSKVFDAPGVVNFLQWLNKPAIAKDAEIEAIRSWLNNDKISDLEVTQFKPGDQVKLKSGKMANQTAVIKEVGDKKLKLILEELGWILTASVHDVV
ncbi:UpxY family transcription antiterminator [Christiangramia sp. LLG6405-1]|uniref:UpxY family transcription antiterminator n=1 Tax=Christiangramia sp. LLG6405-1 TaxID=3160832 RepID=UPI00386D657E